MPLALQKGKIEKKDPALSKLESGFGGMSKNFEESQRASVRAKNAEIAEKMKELKHQKQLKLKAEMDKINKINMGATNF